MFAGTASAMSRARGQHDDAVGRPTSPGSCRVRPAARSCRAACRSPMNAARSWVSLSFSPAAGSSRISRSGLHGERAGDFEVFAPAIGEVGGEFAGLGGQPDRFQRAPSFAPRWRGHLRRRANSASASAHAKVPTAPMEMLSNTVMLGKTRRFWKVRPMPRAGDAVGLLAVDAAALETDLARARRGEAADQVEQRGLAGAVRADQADQLAAARWRR